MIYIIGHKKPDLDSAAAAIALAELKNKTEGGRYVAGRAGEPTAEATYIFKKFGVELPSAIDAAKLKPTDRVILVDHNEKSHRMDNLDPAKIIGIVDHHYRIDLDLNQPTEVLIRPWGASAAIIFNLAKQKGVELSQGTTKLLLAAILSDTLGLQSPTTTDYDRKAAEELKGLTKTENIEALTMEILRAKSDISTLTPKQVVTNDHKVYDFSEKKVLIGQVETPNQEKIISGKEEYLAAMAEIKEEEGLDLIFLAATDPLRKNTKMLFPTESERTIIEAAFGAKGTEGVADIGPRLSRKKEMAPEIEKAVSK